jgi:hypothetical protein
MSGSRADEEGLEPRVLLKWFPVFRKRPKGQILNYLDIPVFRQKLCQRTHQVLRFSAAGPDIYPVSVVQHFVENLMGFALFFCDS